MAQRVSDTDLTGQVALVTGGGRGIGRAIALALAGAGASVAITARTRSEIDDTAEAIEGMGGHALAIPADVTSQDDVARMIAATESSMGCIDLLVANAGTLGPIGPLWQMDPDLWWQTMEVNVRGTFLCCHGVLPGMVERKRGRIIIISSAAALSPRSFLSSYAVGKTAVTRLGEQVAEEAQAHGISVFTIAPGMVRTSMTTTAAASSEDDEWLDGKFQSALTKGGHYPPENAGALAVILASGDADPLTGCWIHITDDIDELLRRVSGDENHDVHKLRLTR